MGWLNLIHYGNTSWRLGRPHNSAQQLSVAAFRRGMRVVYVDPGEVTRPTRVRSRLAIVARGLRNPSREVGRWARRWCFQPSDTLVIISYATLHSLRLAEWARRQGYTVLYRHVDWFAEESGSHFSCAASERICRMARRVFVSHPELRRCLPDAVGEFLSNGVCLRTFARPLRPGPAPPGLICGTVTLGFWGQFWKDRVDWYLVKQLALRRPDWQWNFIGHFEPPDAPPELPANVHFLGYRHPRRLAAYAAHFDCGVVPYRHDLDLARASNPIKVLEMLACQCPVVAADNASLQDYQGVSVYRSLDEAECVIETTARRPRTPELLSRFVADHSWDRKLQTLLES